VRYIIFVLPILITFFVYSARSDEFPFNSNNSKKNGFEKDQIEKGLSEDAGLSENEKSDTGNDKVDFGGSIRNDVTLYQFDKIVINNMVVDRDDYFQDPFILSLYLDNKFSDDFRLFFRGQVSYDGTADTTNNSINPITNEEEKTTRTQLDELKVQFSILKKLFVSLGVQKIKWGSGHFWNPSDFLNQEVKSLVEKEDRRAGLHLAKLHLPINESNLYYIAQFDEKNDVQKTGHAIRYELPLPSSLTSGELSFSYYGKKNQEGRGAGDLSIALGPFDFYFEGSMQKTQENTSFVSGVSYEWQYTDKNFLVLNLESFSNSGGATSTDEYPLMISSNRFIPFYVAQRYLAASIYLPQPWSLTHTDLSFILVHNQIDQGNYMRFGYIWSGYKALTASVFMGTRAGSAESEFRLGGLSNDYLLRVEYKF